MMNKAHNPHLHKTDVMPSVRSKKYNANFERDFKWYLSMRHRFNFDGSNAYFNKKGEDIIQYDSKTIKNNIV